MENYKFISDTSPTSMVTGGMSETTVGGTVQDTISQIGGGKYSLFTHPITVFIAFIIAIIITVFLTKKFVAWMYPDEVSQNGGKSTIPSYWRDDHIQS